MTAAMSMLPPSASTPEKTQMVTRVRRKQAFPAMSSRPTLWSSQ